MTKLFITGIAVTAITFSARNGSNNSKENSSTADAASNNLSLQLKKPKSVSKAIIRY
ncbi:MAG: hypothetical protein WKG06_10390 [Segetibacter sp.]